MLWLILGQHLVSVLACQVLCSFCALLHLILRIILIRKCLNVCFYGKQDVNFVICLCSQLLLIGLGLTQTCLNPKSLLTSDHCTPDLSRWAIYCTRRQLSFHKWCHFGKGSESFSFNKMYSMLQGFWRQNQNAYSNSILWNKEKHTTYNNIRELYILNN